MKALATGLGAILVAGSYLVSWAADGVPAEAAAPALVPAAVARAPGVDESILAAVVTNMTRHLQQAPIRLPVISPSGADNLVEEAQALGAMRPDQAVCLIGLVAHTNDLKTFGAVVPDSKAGVINVSALAEGAEDDAALLGKRVSKEAVNAALLLNGLKPCPNPRCALFPCADVGAVDRKGFGACPPCLYRYLNAAKERGVAVRPLGQ
jgi:hypothetical protein